MLSVNDFIFSMEHGIGQIIQVSNGFYKVKFTDTIIDNVNPLFVTEINNDLVNSLITNEFEDYFNYQALERGRNYFLEDRVLDVFIMGKTISGSVNGNKRYSTTITYSKNAIRSRCDCPVESGCKHAAAILYKAKVILDDFSNQQATISNEDIPNNFIDIIEKLDNQKRGYMYDASKSIQLIDYLNKKDVSFLVDLFVYMNKEYKNKKYSFSQLKRIIYYHPLYVNSSDVITKKLKNNDFFEAFSKDAYMFENVKTRIDEDKLYNVDLELLIDYYLANNNIKKALLSLFKNKIRQYTILSEIPKLIDKITLDDDIINAYKKYVRLDGKDVYIISSAIMKKLKENELLDFVAEMSGYVSISLDKVYNFSKSAQIILLKAVNASDEKVRYIIQNAPIFLALDEVAALKLLGSVYERAKKSDKRQLLNLIRGSKESRYVINYCQSFDGFQMIENNDFDSKLFFKFFDVEYNIIKYDYLNKYDISYKLKFGNDAVISITIDNDNISGYNRLSGKLDNSIIISEMIKYLEENDPNYVKTIYEIKEEILREKRKSEIRRLNSIFDEFVNDDYTTLASFNVKLIPRISYDPYEREFELGFKIGIDRLYIVKNVGELISAIKENKVISYGKNLSFNHNIENFDEMSKEIIDLIIGFPTDELYSYSRQYIKIGSGLVDKILYIYKDKEILINDKSYIIRLNDYDLSVSIDDSYRLSINSNLEDTLITNKEIYIFNDQFLDKCITDSSNKRLYTFALANNDLDIKLAKDRFRDEIYYRYSKYIKLDEKLKDDFKIVKIDIHAYFDYDNGLISVKEDIYKNNTLLDISSLSSVDASKYNVYKSYLKVLGFKENIIPDKDLSLAFLCMDFTRLKELCSVYFSESIKSKLVYQPNTQNIRITYKNSMMNVFVDSDDFNDDELKEILKSIKRKKKYVLLKDNRIIDLSLENIVELSNAVNDLGLNIDNLGVEQVVPTYQILKVNAACNSLSIDEYVKGIIEDIKGFKDYNINIPSINATLREYQKDGFRWLSILTKHNMGGILADDMGLGKTIQIITLLLGDNSNKPSIIVCPKSLIFNWINEFSIFAPSYRVVKIYGNQAERSKIINSINPNERAVYITSYDSLRNDISLLDDIEFNYAVIDEAQYIKNVQALKSKNVKLINAAHRFALTGTPIENNVLDLWSIFDFIMPGYFEEISAFKSKYLSNSNYTEKIAKMVAPFILRRTKKEVLHDLPNKFERIISAEMTMEQRKLYNAMRLEANELLKTSDAFEILPYLTRLRQICVDPQMFVDNYYGKSGKMEMLNELITEYVNDNHKILLFSSFVKALEIIKDNLDKNNIRYLLLTGDTKAEDRIKYANEFNSNSDIKVFLISLKAGGTGLNLVGADTVIHLDPWWNVSAENQATDRAYRIGQTRNVEVIKIIAEESIEQRVIELQNIKKDIIDKIISNDDKSITGFNIEDIGYILR